MMFSPNKVSHAVWFHQLFQLVWLFYSAARLDSCLQIVKLLFSVHRRSSRFPVDQLGSQVPEVHSRFTMVNLMFDRRVVRWPSLFINRSFNRVFFLEEILTVSKGRQVSSRLPHRRNMRFESSLLFDVVD